MCSGSSSFTSVIPHSGMSDISKTHTGHPCREPLAFVLNLDSNLGAGSSVLNADPHVIFGCRKHHARFASTKKISAQINPDPVTTSTTPTSPDGIAPEEVCLLRRRPPIAFVRRVYGSDGDHYSVPGAFAQGRRTHHHK